MLLLFLVQENLHRILHRQCEVHLLVQGFAELRYDCVLGARMILALADLRSKPDLSQLVFSLAVMNLYSVALIDAAWSRFFGRINHVEFEAFIYVTGEG